MTNKEIERAAALLSLTDIAKLLREIGRPLLAEEVDRCAAALTSPPAPSGWQPGDALLNPVNQVYFRAGLLACREYMARFVEALDPTSAQAIRASWWPSLGADPGAPRKMEWSEVTEGEFGTPSFRCKTAEEVSPSIEALPVALGFLELPPAGGQHAKDAIPPSSSEWQQRVSATTDALVQAGLVKASERGLVDAIIGSLSDALPPAPEAAPAKPQPRHLAPRCPRCVARTHVRLVADASHAEAPEDVWQCEICLHEFTVSAADASPAKETR